MQPWLKPFFRPQPIVRLAFLRFGIPLAILGFLSLRLAHADYWLGDKGFWVPKIMGTDWRQPWYFPALPIAAAWALAASMVISGLCSALGFYTRCSLAIFLAGLAYVSLVDRLDAFTVNKLGTILVLGLLCTPCGAAYSLDALRRRRRTGLASPQWVTWGNVRFFQVLLVVLYTLTGVSKLQGDWLKDPYVLWTHLHDSYQTAATFWIANHLPALCWPLLAKAVLTLETLAPLWFALPWTRTTAMVLALGMHAFIGLCFGPVIWFALLMSTLLLGCFAPEKWMFNFVSALFPGTSHGQSH